MTTEFDKMSPEEFSQYGAGFLAKFITFCAMKHQNQLDKGGNPYILHPLHIMSQGLTLYPGDWELACIHVGHDTVEDTDTTYEEIRQLGATERIIEGIRALTKIPGQSKLEYRAAVFANQDAVKVKKQDLIHNSSIQRLKGISEKDLKRAQYYHAFYTEIVHFERTGKWEPKI
jgi:guanosine-3',5'-bis(diphosphate) 3'-pyrophosphohydrolase